MIKAIKYTGALVLISILTFSCGVSDPSKTAQGRPTALGKMNQVVVISDDVVWNSVVGDTINYLFSSAYPITPSPEPTFDLRRFQVGELAAQPLKKQLRTYLIVANLSDEESPTTKFIRADLGEEGYDRAMSDPTFNTSVGRDKWANNQILIYVFARSLDELATAIEKNYDGIAAKVLEHDSEQLYAAAYVLGEGDGYANMTQERFGAAVNIPSDYKIALDNPDDNGLIWFRRDIKESVMCIAVRQYTYDGPASIEKDAVKANFDVFGRNVSSDADNSYIQINDCLLYTSPSPRDGLLSRMPSSA